MISLLCVLATVVCVVRCTSYELLDYNPVADPKAVVQVGNARFTVLTPQVLRIEQVRVCVLFGVSARRLVFIVVPRQHVF